MLRRELATIGLALLTALVAGSVLILVVGESPLVVYQLLLKSTWGTRYGIGQVLFKTTPLVLTGLSVAVAFKVGLFNIGAQGQLVAGSFVTALAGAYLPPGTPGPVAVVLCVGAGMVAGGLVGALPGLLKARYGAHEVINTIMLNFIVSALVLWAGNSLFFVAYTTHTKTVIASSHLHHLGFEGSAANTSLFFALVLAALVHLFLTRTRHGFEWRAVGFGQRAAENAGVSLKGAFIGAMALSGALAGAAGANYVLGYKHYFERDIGSGVGFMGIAVALLGRNHPAGIVASALLFATLAHGGLEVSELVPKELVEILQAVIILAVAAASAYSMRRRVRAGVD
ncbi:MAG TPA: ABC transporter permease [Kofleriaceae bacterium]|nr:ABC transporter permease [Kofleriaceae bacterium]